MEQESDSNITKFVLEIVDKAIEIRHNSYRKALKYDGVDISESKEAQRDMIRDSQMMNELFSLIDEFEVANGKVPIYMRDV